MHNKISLIILALLFGMAVALIPVSAAQSQTTTDIISGIRWNADDTKLAVGILDGELQIRDANTQAVVTTIPSNVTGEIYDWAFSTVEPNLLAIASAHENDDDSSRLILFDISINQIIYSTERRFRLQFLDWSFDGNYLSGTASQPATVFMPQEDFVIWSWDGTNLQPIYTDTGDGYSIMSWHPDELVLLSDDFFYPIYTFDLATRDYTMVADVADGEDRQYRDIGWHPDGEHIIVLNSEFVTQDNDIRAEDLDILLLNKDSGSLDRTINIGTFPFPVGFGYVNPQYPYYVVRSKGINGVVSLQTGGFSPYLLEDENTTVISVVAWSTDGTKLAFSIADKLYILTNFHDCVVDGVQSVCFNFADAPTGLAVTASPPVALVWQDNSADETGFIVARQIDGGEWQDIATLPADSTAFTDIACGNLTYRVRATRTSPLPLDSLPSNAVSFVVDCPTE